jgi:hypothetical protein
MGLGFCSLFEEHVQVGSTGLELSGREATTKQLVA